MNLKTQTTLAKKAFYAGIGAPVVAGRMVKEYGEKLASHGSKLGKAAQERFDEFSTEGEKVTKQLRDADVVEEIQSRVDFDKVQDRVEKMRDQLEGALENWRESFTPAAAKPVAAKPVTTKKPAAKKATVSRPAAKKPATKVTAKPAAKKATATKAAAKPVAKKAPGKTTARKTTTAKKAPAKTAAKK